MGTSSERVFNGSEKGYLPAGTIGNRTHIPSEWLKAGTEFKRLKKGRRPAPTPLKQTHILSYKPKEEPLEAYAQAAPCSYPSSAKLLRPCSSRSLHRKTEQVKNTARITKGKCLVLRTSQAKGQAAPAERFQLILRLFIATKKQAKSVTASDLQIYWSGRRESNPRHQLGRLGFYH